MLSGLLLLSLRPSLSMVKGQPSQAAKQNVLEGIFFSPSLHSNSTQQVCCYSTWGTCPDSCHKSFITFLNPAPMHMSKYTHNSHDSTEVGSKPCGRASQSSEPDRPGVGRQFYHLQLCSHGQVTSSC